ncbi:hypothetical protein [Roseibium aggregatum]|uniref:Uncharacterized protein n=1 Tax=Roseibium aggregatum TaxID=187304 RepID=A0A926P3E6_9HYPH|nr:hypothetical protein [Roseibium aggregatum]MBD1549375.1 hypothetical protein [Roseibium aggregatum]
MHNSRLWKMADETVDLFVKTVRLPTTLLEKVSDALENARKRQARSASYQEEPSRPARMKPPETSQT